MNLLIKKLKISGIAFCLNANPATGEGFIIKKSAEGGENIMDELVGIYNNIFDEEISKEEIEKIKFDEAAAKEILAILEKYAPDVPEDLLSAWQKLSKLLLAYAKAGYKYPYPAKDEGKEGEIKKGGDPWPSLGNAGGPDAIMTLTKLAYLFKNELAGVKIDEHGNLHKLGKKRGIEGSGDDPDLEDHWKSLG